MDSDLFLVMGMVVAGISAPAIFGGIMGGHVRRLPLVFFILGLGLMAYAGISRPSGYRFQDVPPAISHVIEKYL